MSDDARIVRIPLTTASPEGENSAYLLVDRGVLIDPGPAGEESWAALRVGVEGAGRDLGDVDHVLVTHWHGDHAGQATRLADRAGATLHMHAEDAPLVGDYARERRARLDRDARRLREWGVPDGTIARLRDRDTPSPTPETYPVAPHEDGETVAGLTVVHTPGHTLGHTAFALDDHLFAGDALLPMYTPNVGGSDTRLRDALGRYLDTLDRLGAGEWTVHPGHGADLAFPDRLETIRDHHRERATHTLAVVEDHGPLTPWDAATRLFGEMRGIHVKMGAGEAAAHLVRLEREGAVERTGETPVTYDAR